METLATSKKKLFGTGGAKRRYGIGKGKGGFKLAKLAADLEMVKNRLNVERVQDADISTFAAGQVNQNSDGLNWFDVTPDIPQGTDSDERVGNSLKLTGMTFPLQFTQQSSCLGARKLRVSLFRVLSADNGVTGTEVAEDYWDLNPLTGVRDFSAPRAYRSAKNDGVKCIRSIIVHVPATSTDNCLYRTCR